MATQHSSFEITQSLDEDPLLDAPLLPSQNLQSDIRTSFHPVPTVCIAVILLLVNIAFVALAFVAGIVCSLPPEGQCRPYIEPLDLQTVLLTAKVIMWLLQFILERYMQHHHRKARSRGYLCLYRATRHLKTLPLLVHSTGNAALLLILSTQLSFSVQRSLYVYVILGVLGLELLATLLCMSVYTVKIGKFNRAMPRPDIIEEEKLQTYPHHVNAEIGFRDGTSLDEVVEKQGDVIEYLQRHNAILSRRLLAMASQQAKH
ncbi:transmembrane protein 192 [Ambystoma mexicanum]|uniref:transmembrane protein 192 n=1 Tax=Ambystoma mexicanum TaxID=8296 RepID=UPI0037E7CEA2